MTSHDTLRNEIAEVLYDWGETKGDALLVSHAVMQVLVGARTSPDRQRAILDLIGFDVSRASFRQRRDGTYDLYVLDWPVMDKYAKYAKYLVLRPREEQADG